MKAMVYTRLSGLDALQIREVPKPEPNDNQVVVAVKAASFNITDYQRFTGLEKEFSLSKKIMAWFMRFKGQPIGSEIAGQVVEVGKNISHIRQGDAVFGKTPAFFSKGGFAQYALLNKEGVCLKPSSLTFEEASALPSSFEAAWGGINKAKIKAGQRVLIYGASGGVGLYVLQLAKSKGAKVTSVCSTRNLELARKMGSDTIIDYKKEDFTQIKQQYDRIIAVNGCYSLKTYRKLLTDNGIFVALGNAKQLCQAAIASLFLRNVKFFSYFLTPPKDYLAVAKDLAEANRLKPHIDKVYSVSDTKSAISYIITQHTQGKVVVKMDFKE
ncbi:NAD(P)-dependent alcohol dehydrogenase [Streptococcus dentiloxodontae]